MSRRAVPTRPGWWWVGTFDGDRVFDLSVVEVCRFDGGLRARFNGDWFEFEQVTRAWHGTRDWIEPVANPETLAALRAEVASLQARISDFEKYTEIMCPDCGAPTDGLPDGWPAS
jgi:hypothetical protein